MNDLSFNNGILDAILSIVVISLDVILASVAIGLLLSAFGVL